jgi:heme-degrading monooxygenase HmoA
MGDILAAPVVEHAVRDVRPGLAGEFEEAMAQALPIIEAVPGCRGARVMRCVERPDAYLLLVGWDSVEAHTIGFRGSEPYERWRTLLHHFYDPFPVVAHFVDRITTGE